MASVDVTTARAGQATGSAGASTAAAEATDEIKQDKVLPLPSWLKKAYYIFPVVLYIPDAIFNFWVYSDGVKRTGNTLFDTGQMVLWACVSLGVVGMAYLLSVLAPWHWGQGHRVQAFFCGLGVLIATAITTWNSLSYRSSDFTLFNTDKWAYQMWPQLQTLGVSVTMVLVSIAPPFWGLFWAIVQPTETGRTLRQIQESYQEKLLRTQQEAELKAMRAEANARVRAAQLKGMAATAAAAREQAKTIFKKDGEQEPAATDDSTGALNDEQNQTESDSDSANKVLKLPSFSPTRDAATRGGAVLFNHAAAATPTVRSAPSDGIAASMAQPALLGDTDALGQRQPPSLGGLFSPLATETDDLDGATGTTGPRPAIRRDSTLLQRLNEPAHVRLVLAAMKQVNIPTGKRSLTNSQWQRLLPVVVEQLNIDETTAKALISRVLRSEASRSSQV
jgi:hypothetical protein